MKAIEPDLALAAQWIMEADGLLITAGAGMGIDSGLPDFRGPQGFWRAYPALGAANISFEEIANGMAFKENPRLAWGFYGHRLQLYRDTVPHEGFRILQQIAAQLGKGAQIYTSNVDGQFQRAGFPESTITECHGSIHYLQCAAACRIDIWPADELKVSIDEASCTWRGPLPSCPSCGGVARPNILMFNDWSWLSERTDRQYGRLNQWINTVEHPVIIELGAGTAIPTVRRKGEILGPPLIRINLRDAQVRSCNAVGIAMGALGGLRALQAHLDVLG
jgi:NAD-dependent SIR2 family protein deacetylase